MTTTKPENYMDGIDIDALIAEGKKASLSAAHDDCGLLGDLADALEAQQAVVEAARAYVKGSLYDSTALCKALAALGALTEGSARFRARPLSEDERHHMIYGGRSMVRCGTGFKSKEDAPPEGDGTKGKE